MFGELSTLVRRPKKRPQPLGSGKVGDAGKCRVVEINLRRESRSVAVAPPSERTFAKYVAMAADESGTGRGAEEGASVRGRQSRRRWPTATEKGTLRLRRGKKRAHVGDPTTKTRTRISSHLRHVSFPAVSQAQHKKSFQSSLSQTPPELHFRHKKCNPTFLLDPVNFRTRIISGLRVMPTKL